jgi:hypothetical protein
MACRTAGKQTGSVGHARQFFGATDQQIRTASIQTESS